MSPFRSNSRALPILLSLLLVLAASVKARAAAPTTAAAAAAAAASTPTSRSTLGEYAIRPAGVDRRYLLHVPADLDPARPAPLVMMLHGAGGSAEVAARGYGWRDKADREGFVAVFPEGTRADLPPAPAATT